MSKKFSSCILVVVLLLLVLILVLFDKNETRKAEGFCNCLGMSYQTCPNPTKLQFLYKHGMTENDIPPNGYNGRVAMPYDAAMPALNSLPSKCKKF